MRSCSRAFNHAASFALVVALLLTGADARATLLIEKFRGGSAGTGAGTASGAEFYYPTTTAATGGSAFLDIADDDSPYRYSAIDLTSTVVTENTVDTDSDSALYFRVTSNSATVKPGTGQTLYLTMTILKDATTASTTHGSFAAVDGNRCDNSTFGCGTGAVSGAPNANRRYTVPFSGSTIIQLFPNALCGDYRSQTSGDAAGCTNSVVSTVAQGAPVRMLVKFQVFSLATADTAIPTSGELDSSGVIGITFQDDYPTMDSSLCPNPVNVYFPGDEQISLKNTQFGIGNNNGSHVSGAAGAEKVMVFFSETVVPDPTSTADLRSGTFTTKRAGINTGQAVIKGFINTTDGNDHKYNVSFAVRDGAGLVARSPAGGNCRLTGVQTAQIAGFLKKNACFIATAAYRSGDAAPVVMLREFRDSFLLNYALGRAFVTWYYSWSPGAAGWLMAHPVFRYPVLVALIPIELLAWLVLHPRVFLILLGLVVAALSFYAYSRGRGAVPGASQ